MISMFMVLVVIAYLDTWIFLEKLYIGTNTLYIYTYTQSGMNIRLGKGEIYLFFLSYLYNVAINREPIGI